jgi:hypothetical protein
MADPVYLAFPIPCPGAPPPRQKSVKADQTNSRTKETYDEDEDLRLLIYCA